jgi:hypothetical protein
MTTEPIPTPEPPVMERLLEELAESERDVPLDVRRELMACAISNGGISYHWLCRLYKRGRSDGEARRSGA